MTCWAQACAPKERDGATPAKTAPRPLRLHVPSALGQPGAELHTEASCRSAEWTTTATERHGPWEPAQKSKAASQRFRVVAHHGCHQGQLHLPRPTPRSRCSDSEPHAVPEPGARAEDRHGRKGQGLGQREPHVSLPAAHCSSEPVQVLPPSPQACKAEGTRDTVNHGRPDTRVQTGYAPQMLGNGESPAP